MPYIKKTYYMPYRIDVEKVHSNRYGKKGYKISRKEKPSSEDVKKRHEKERIKKLYRKIACNFDFGDYHAVLTYKKENRPTPEEAKKQLKGFFQALRREYKKLGKELKYIITTEYKGKAIHHHLIINEIGHTAKLLKKLWKVGSTYLSVIYEDGNVEELAAYLIKETRETFRDADSANKLAYSCSRNLIEPKVVTEVVKADTWLNEPKAIKGYRVDKNSVVSGISMITGYPYQYYTLIKEEQSDRQRDLQKNKRHGPQGNG